MTFDFELDYAEYLDEALCDAWEMRESLAQNEELPEEERKWWILKPGMSERGQGIRLFSTMEELEEIFAEFDPDSDDEEEEDDDEDTVPAARTVDAEERAAPNTSVITSHLRHFIAQEYVHPPLLLPASPENPSGKFHIRTYILCAGALKVYVFRDMLALFSSSTYTAPSSSPDSLPVHLTNTCYQTKASESSAPSSSTDSTPAPSIVHSFRTLPLPVSTLDNIYSQICETTRELFTAAAQGQRIHFQALPNGFEVFGVDFVVDAEESVKVLEVNAYPDFGQTGAELGGIVGGVVEGIAERVVKGFFEGEKEGEGKEGENGGEAEKRAVTGKMDCVLELELGGF